MRTDKVSIEEAKDFILKFFAFHFDIQRVVHSYKDTRAQDQILDSIRDSIKQQLLQIEGELLAARQIQTLRIYDNINSSRIMENLLDLKAILNPDTIADFLTYYKYKSQFFIMSRFQIIEVPVDPITSKKKLAIYQSFIEYFEQKNAFEISIAFNGPEEIEVKDFEASLLPHLYTKQETESLYKIYNACNGQLQLISMKLQQVGLKKQKYHKNSLKKVLLSYLSIGLGRIYKLSNNLDKFSGCSWQKFQRIHRRLMRTFPFEEKSLILKMGIYNNLQDRDIMIICNKIGIRYRPVGYPKWTKDNSGSNLYRKQKMSVMEKIKDQMRNIMRSEMKVD